MPYYRINEKGVEKPRLVEADNPAAALKHVAETNFTVSKPLKPADLVPLMGAGAVVEKAGEKPAETAPEAGDEA